MPIDHEATPTDSGATRGVLCVDCEHLNPPGEQQCRKCAAELYVVCRSCGHRNERVYTQCNKCRRSLVRSRWEGWMKKLFGRKRLMLLVALGNVVETLPRIEDPTFPRAKDLWFAVSPMGHPVPVLGKSLAGTLNPNFPEVSGVSQAVIERIPRMSRS